MVYTSSSLSLAVVEVFVHLDPAESPEFVSIAVDVPVDERKLEAEKVAILTKLPVDWREIGHPLLRKMGADWIASGRSLVMPVPSAIVDGEWNVLINPMHLRFSAIKFDQPKPFQFDPRMFKR